MLVWIPASDMSVAGTVGVWALECDVSTWAAVGIRDGVGEGMCSSVDGCCSLVVVVVSANVR